MANMTLGEAKVNAIKYINQFSISGEIIDETDPNYQDFILRMNPLADTANKELAKISKIAGKMSISQNQIPNQLGAYAFNELQHFPGTDREDISTGTKSFSIEVDGDCSIYFDEEVSGIWTPLNGTYSLDGTTPEAFTGSIAVTATTYENYKGLLTIASATNQIRMKVVATYPMKSRYRALFAYAFATALKVPHYMAFIPYDLPEDYAEFNLMMRSFDERQFEENRDYKLTPDKKIHLNWFLSGSFDIHYWASPEDITNTTPDSYVFKTGKDAQSAIPWFMGGYAILPTKQGLGTQLINQYYVLRDGLTTPKTSTSSEVQSVLFTTNMQRTNKLRV